MKRRIKFLLSAILMAIAVAGAFTTHAMSQKAKESSIVNGYVKLNPMGTSCEQSPTECTTVNTGVICTVDHDPSGAQLFLIESNGSCTQPLFRPSSK